MQQVDDFVAESEALHRVLEPLGDPDFQRPTQFKGWTIDHVLQHLHFFNRMADLSLNAPAQFQTEYGAFDSDRRRGQTMVEITDRLLDGLSGRALLAEWRSTCLDMAPRFSAADPKARVKWAGPDMSVRSSITARLMETWAHGQEIFDLLGLARQDTDRIRNIAHLGVQTYGWTFINRKADVPEPMPHVRLTAPSGAIWEWGAPSTSEQISGDAAQFCQVVTQTRNIADTALSVTGPNAKRWMEIAQCFAGPPEDPPEPGTRRPT